MKRSEKIRRKTFNAIGLLVNRLSQNESSGAEVSSADITDGMPELLKEAAAEGSVLLRNDGVLPLSKSETLSVFGRTQNDWFYVGYGSGGDVIKPYTVNLTEGLRNCGAKLNEELSNLYLEWCEKNPPDHGFWGHWPHYYEEMPIDTETINSAAEKSDCAVVVIGRAAGEDRENSLTAGSYLLTEDEESLIARVSGAFEKTVIVLNIGGIIDMSWEKRLLKNKTALLIPWQGGMESGNAVAEVLFGIKEPSGRLPDTIAQNYSDYPCSDNFGNKDFCNYAEDIFVGYRYFETFCKEKVLYPFGFGLGYGDFKRTFSEGKRTENSVILKISTKNRSPYPSKDVIQIYAEAPQGVLGKPARVLCAFKKTEKLFQNEKCETVFEIPFYDFSSYDDNGASGHRSSYILENGEYNFYMGSDVGTAEKIFSFTLENTLVLKKLKEVSAPKFPFERMTAKTDGNGKLYPSFESVPLASNNLTEIISAHIPDGFGYKGDVGITLQDVKSGKETLENFIAQLSPKELEALSRGDYVMNSPLGAKGNAGVFGGVLPSLRKKGVPPITVSDGPSGIRLSACCSLLPDGTSVASMWNPKLAFSVYKKLGTEMKNRGSDILLAPAMNIHRSPLCGRNFEYYSEDPYLSGKTGASVVGGLQSEGVGACPKHFACNSQETNRNANDSRLSERALREIYLKGFEICVKDAQPLTVMTSYNKVNGVWSHYNYELCTRILREEWNFDGFIMTDWWMQYAKSPEFPNLKDNAYRVRSGVDVLMPGGKRVGVRKSDGTLLKTYGKPNGITLGEMQKTAKHILNVIMKLK